MIGQIIKRELMMLSRSRAMILSAVVIVVLILAAGVVGKLLLNGDDAPSTTGSEEMPTIAVEEQMNSYEPYLEKVTGGQVKLISDVPGGAEDTLKDHDIAGIDGAIIVLAGEPGAPEIVSGSDGFSGADEHLSHVVHVASTAWLMEQQGLTLTDADYATLAGAVSVPVRFVEIGTANLMMVNPLGYASSFIGVMIMFMMIIMGITTISNGVVEEKSSRVVEIVLTTTHPRTLLLGKVLGIGIFLFLQFALYIAAAVVALNIAGLWIDLNLGSFLGWMFVWLVLGFFFYAMATGALASTASRQEDLGAVTTPITMSLLIPFYVGLFLVPNAPDSMWTKVLSMIPGFSPFVMPVRQAYETVTMTELIIAAALGVVAIPLVAAIAGKIYENSILHTGKRLKISEALRARN